MDRKAVAKELRQRLFDFIEAEHKEALQDAAIDELFEKVLAKHEPTVTVTPTWPYVGTYTVLARDKNITVTPYQEKPHGP
jgi:hypothetical protein